MSGATKLMTAGGGGVSLTPASSIASDVTVNVPVTGVSGGTLVCSDSSGNVGIGTSSPATPLQIYSGAQEQFRLSRNSTSSSGYMTFYANNASSTQVQYAGILGDVASSTAGSHGGNLLFYTTGSGTAAERMRIDSSGNLLVGKTATGATTVGGEVKATGQIFSTLSTNNGTDTFKLYSTAAGANRFYVLDTGSIYATSTSITAISDQTLKENIRDLETGLPEVMALRPRRFDWKNGDAHNVAGFVAQEVEQVLPELVSDYVYNTDEEGNNIIKKSLKMGDILPTLVKAIQELNEKVEAQAAEIAALKGAA